MPNLSLVTCAYNPDSLIFNRVLSSIAGLVTENIQFEYVIVDNNSNPPVESLEYVQEFLKKNSWAKVIKEETQGVSFARRLGIISTTAPVVIFIDDDNELDSNYLIHALSLIDRYPFIGIWGAGNIEVELPPDVPSVSRGDLKRLFLEKKTLCDQYTTVIELSSPAYAICAGMVARRHVLEKYVAFSMSNDIKTTGRVAESGDSWEDTQMNWISIREGMAVGTSPSLCFNHLIAKKRVHMHSILKLIFEGNSGGRRAISEVFPVFLNTYKKEFSSQNFFVVKYMIGSLPFLLKFNIDKWRIYTARYWGNINSYYVALSLQPSFLIRLILKSVVRSFA